LDPRAPRRWLALLARKLLLLVNAYEIPDSEGLYSCARSSSILRVLGTVLHLGVVLPLAIVGAWLAGRDGRRPGILIAILVRLALGVVTFYVFERYRYPLVPRLMILAAAVELGIVERFRRATVVRGESENVSDLSGVRWPVLVAIAAEALRIARGAGLSDLARELEARRMGYSDGQPWRSQ